MNRARLMIALLLAGATAVSSSGCTARAGMVVHAGPPLHHYYYEPATLVYVDSHVWVLRDASYPVYFCDGYYWAYYDYVWYRSHTYEGSWVRVDIDFVPERIVRRDHHVYVHYFGTGLERTRIAPRGPRMRPASLEEPAPRVLPAPPIRRPRLDRKRRLEPKPPAVEPRVQPSPRRPRRIEQPSPPELRPRERLEQPSPPQLRPRERPAPPRAPPVRPQPAPEEPKRPWMEATR